MIPPWINGVIPPIRPGMPATGHQRSPYPVSICDLVEKFSTSKQREMLLECLLNYRESLYQAGIENGFQWIGGSFIEDIENLENRDPNDIDVLTFFYLPQGMSQEQFLAENMHLFESELVKNKYHIDAFYLPLGREIEKNDVRLIAYWTNMWSHRRNGLWKGFLQIDLSKREDELAINSLKLSGSYES